MRRILAALVSALVTCGTARAQTTGATTNVAKSVHAHVVTGPVAETDWQKAELLTAFVQREPSEGTPATYETEARVIADGAALHVVVDAKDPDPDKIVGYLTRRRLTVRLDSPLYRLLSRPADGLPVCRQRRRCEAGLLLVQRRQQRRQLGRRVGRERQPDAVGMARGIPYSVFPAPVQQRFGRQGR